LLYLNFPSHSIILLPSYTYTYTYTSPHIPTMDAEAQQGLLTSIKLMKELKDLIVCTSLHLPDHPQPPFTLQRTNNLTGEARATFISTETPPTYDVVISKPNGSEYEARLILYPSPAFKEWKMLMANPSCCKSPVDAMADLLEAVYERANAERGKKCGMCGGRVLTVK
jgi:hypothetical protein